VGGPGISELDYFYILHITLKLMDSIGICSQSSCDDGDCSLSVASCCATGNAYYITITNQDSDVVSYNLTASWVVGTFSDFNWHLSLAHASSIQNQPLELNLLLMEPSTVLSMVLN